jgi:hypothetical protein
MIASAPEHYAEAARLVLADGYDALKLDPVTIGRDGLVGHAAKVSGGTKDLSRRTLVFCVTTT